jgi:hypothetical protein
LGLDPYIRSGGRDVARPRSPHRRRPARKVIGQPVADNGRYPLLAHSGHPQLHSHVAFGGKADIAFCGAHVRF